MEILLPGRSYGNQDRLIVTLPSDLILLPGRSYGNQDGTAIISSKVKILLPGRSYGNQDTSKQCLRLMEFYYLGDRTVIKTSNGKGQLNGKFYYLGDRTVIKAADRNV